MARIDKIKESLKKGKTLVALIIYCTENDSRTITADELLEFGLKQRSTNTAADRKRIRHYISDLLFVNLLIEDKPKEYTVNQSFALNELL